MNSSLNINNIVIIYYLLMNILSFILYYVDKRKAIKSKWRIKESHLLLSSFLGGAVGSFIAMHVFKHKTKHKKFTILVPLFIIIHIIIYIFLKINYL